MAKWQHVSDIEQSLVPDERGCWIWQGKLNPGGYGHTKFKGQWEIVHRLVWQQEHGPLPEGLVLDHLCRNRRCANPNHLEPVTVQENNRRGSGWCGRNARKTACIRGHPLSGANLIVNEKGHRRCRACRGEKYRRLRERKIAAGWVPRYPKTKCKNGHPYSAENTAYYPSGGRRCMACNREYATRVYANKTSPEAVARAQRAQQWQDELAEMVDTRQQRQSVLVSRERLTPVEQSELRLLTRWLSENGAQCPEAGQGSRQR